MRIAFIPGDGIGPEVIAEAEKVLHAVSSRESFSLSTTTYDYGADRYLKDGTTLPKDSIERFKQDHDAIVIGAVGDPRIPDGRHARDILLGLRFGLDLYINLRPIKLIDRRLCPLKDKAEEDVQIVCFRENTEGLYAGVGGLFKKGTPDEIAINEDLNTRKGVERIIRAAFDYARCTKRKRLCMSDKNNAIQYAHDLWRRVFDELAPHYPDVTAEHLYIDVLAMRLVQAPERFDVIVTCNLFGDIITDLGAGLTGGLGLAASANIHPGQLSLFEPVHGSAPDIVGKGIANPMGAISTVALMLKQLGQIGGARRIDRAIKQCVTECFTTPDLGGTETTRSVGNRLCQLVMEYATSATE